MSLLIHAPHKRGRLIAGRLVYLGILFGAAALVSSCLTPSFDFDPDGAGTTDGDGGDGGEDGSSSGGASDGGSGGVNAGGSGGFSSGGSGGSLTPPDHCENEVRDEGETDLNCGGGECEPCGATQKCAVPNDCKSFNCDDHEQRCLEATCEDDIKNQGERDIDCGGPCGACDVGQACIEDEHCLAPSDSGAVGVPICNSRICALECPDTTADCDTEAKNGCEVDLATDLLHCGACEDECSLVGATASVCSEGECKIDGGCLDGFEDCNSKESDGCEIELTSDVENCGACDAVCSNNNGEPSCEASECAITCESGHSDCDDDPATNGCEFPRDGCSYNCPSNFCPDLEDPEAPCSIPLGTVSNCSTCGEQCSGTNPFCDGANGCKQRFPIDIVSETTRTGSGGATIVMNLTLANGSSSGRALAILVASAQEITVKIGATTVLPIVSKKAGPQPGLASIYYLPDAVIGSGTSKTISIESGWGGKVIAVFELTNAPQVVPTQTASKESTACPIDNTVTAPVIDQGSLVLGVLLAQGLSQVTGSIWGMNQQVISSFPGEQATGMIGYVEGVSASTEVGWKTLGTSCYATALATVTLGPLITGP